MTVPAPPIERFRSLRGTDGYLLEEQALGTEIRVERLRRDRHELLGELTVTCRLPGAQSVLNGTLHAADFNLSSARARVERARILGERAATNGQVDWASLLEEFCQRVIAAERLGAPAVDLRDVVPAAADDALLVDRLALPRRHPTILFGDGGCGKSLLALNVAGRLAQAGMTVLFADWEYAAEDHRLRLGGLFGDPLPSILYVRAERPMVAEADRLSRLAREHRVDYLIVDSIAFACDGPPESAEVAAGYFRALRRIGVGSLNVAHITKAEGGDSKPFGSTFWHNGARATWFAQRSGEDDGPELVVGLYNRKSNAGPRSAPFGYRIGFDVGRIEVEPTELDDVADLAARMSVRQRMIALLRGGAKTMVEIASELEVPVDTIKKTERRGRDRLFTRVVGADGIYRIGLAARAA
jgi:AAA domain